MFHMTIKLTTAEFKKRIFDYTANQEWKYIGPIPAIIDFYSDWCGPCKMVAPILEELSKQYDGKVLIYKVDTDAEEELAAIFNIRSIPSLLFIPQEGQPMMQAGALPKHVFERVIEEHLLASKTESTS